MGRKRLLTILAGVIAALGLQVGSAAAVDLGAELDKTVSDTVEGVEDTVEGAAKVTEDPEEAVKDTVDGVEKTLEGATDGVERTARSVTEDPQETVEDTTDRAGETVEETVDQVEETVEDTVEETVDETTGGSGGGQGGSGGDDGGRSGSGGDEGGEDADDTEGDDTEGEDAENDASVEVSGDGEQLPERPDPIDPRQARQLLAGADPRSRGGSGGAVSPAFDLSSRFDTGGGGGLDAPLIADAPEATRDEEQWEIAAPEVSDERSDAELAAVPFGDGDEIPAGLKLLAALMVAGTGTVWHVTRRELQNP